MPETTKKGHGLTAEQIEEHLSKLKDYIALCRQKGFSSEAIKTQLVGAGWPEDVLLPLLAEPEARSLRKVNLLGYRAVPICGVVGVAVWKASGNPVVGALTVCGGILLWLLRSLL